jgi:hypothetical protein
MTDTLREQWAANNDRLHWIQAHREELQTATGLTIPGRLHELDEWLDGHKGVVTRKLREQADTDIDTDTDDT